MKTLVHQRDVGVRPFVEVEESDHLLSIHQRHGITEHEIQVVVSHLMHAQ